MGGKSTQSPEYWREYYSKNREAISARKKKYRAQNKTRLNQESRNYYAKNKEKARAKSKEYYQLNKESILKRQKDHYHKKKIENKELMQKARKDYHINNKEKINKSRRDYYKDNKEKILARNRAYHKNNREKIARHRFKKRRENPNFHLACNFRSRISNILGRAGASKLSDTFDLVGCSIEKLKSHLEAQFTEGMSWKNYGKDGWHIDHIKPCASFNLNKLSEQKKCFHYTNLQPLWWEDNLSKGSHYKGERFFY